MKITFKDCMAKKRIFSFPPAKHLVDLEIEDAENDLQSAQEEFSKSGIKWATIKGYYSMFHAARALLYSRGYREKGHYCLYLAMGEFFVKEKKLDASLAEDLNNCMILREEADYRRKFSQEGASGTIEAAKRFLKAAKDILKN
ncbi:MAG: HEPN domain-containing protein [Candidatus Omnitrophota bacterium]